MKNILYILLLSVSACIAQDRPLFNKVLKIKYLFGDKNQNTKEMTFFYENTTLYGRITIPNTDVLIDRRAKIDEAALTTLTTFIQLSRAYQNGCTETDATAKADYYVITLDNETFRITQSCDWKTLTYPNLEKKIFGKKSKEQKKRTKVTLAKP